jgi:hypothetical protein
VANEPVQSISDGAELSLPDPLPLPLLLLLLLEVMKQ